MVKKKTLVGYANVLWKEVFRYFPSSMSSIGIMKFPAVQLKETKWIDGRSHKKVKVRITIEEV